MAFFTAFNNLFVLLGLFAVAVAQQVPETQTTGTLSLDCPKCISRGCFSATVKRKRLEKCSNQWDCNLQQCRKKHCRKCSRYECFSGELTGDQQKKCDKWGCGFLTDCPGSLSDGPKASPPEQKPYPKSATGQICAVDADCISNTCRSGVCMATSECYPLKHDHGTPFDTNKVILVFVGSGFDVATSKAWRAQVNETYGVFDNYNMFARGNPQLNVFFVESIDMQPSFCDFNCGGIDRLLCCDLGVARELADKCFPNGQNLQTVVIHNDSRYGGAGYRSSNLATTSINYDGPLVAIHELGHSLFELSDEYSTANGDPSRANCAATSDCDKWNDLIGNTPAGYEGVSCEPGCMGSRYFIPEQSFMHAIENPVGAVNERFTCCTYLALTGSMPPYCNSFDFSKDYLLDYCRNNDYQNYGSSSYSSESAVAIPDGESTDTAEYIHVSAPMFVRIGFSQGSKRASILGTPSVGPSGLYRKRRVRGDFVDVAEAAQNGVDLLVKITVTYGRRRDVLYFSQKDAIQVPPSPMSDKTEKDGGPRLILKQPDVLELALDSKGDIVIEIQIEKVRTSQSHFR